eukprot:TRINITY_DN26358_c0_g1_i1.p1 TRINITY_DN26358_c0_g1~~TRINITY_DN26358_c0_g1_i1.p1  ORF type:complete len:287 (-),score=57.62 TRINITY_DN26358_c0_g1_i1:2-862(-)
MEGKVVYDFDGTLTVDSTLEALFEEVCRLVEDERVREEKKEGWKGLGERYYREYSQLVESWTKREVDGSDLRKVFEELHKLEASFFPVIAESKVFAGVCANWRDLGVIQSKKTGFLNAPDELMKIYTRLKEQAIHCTSYVLSMYWSRKFIIGATESLGIFREADVYANEWVVDEHGVTSGEVEPIVISGVDKELLLEKICGESGGKNCACIYIGDSFADVLAMLKADKGVLLVQNQRKREEMLKLLEHFKIRFQRFNNDEALSNQKEVLVVDKWEEVEQILVKLLK